jgi:hypothetical protein
MSRDINSLVIDAIKKDAITMCHLVEIHLETSVYLTDASQDIINDGHTYIASSHFLSLQSVKETADIRVGTTRLKLSGVEQSFISLFLQEHYVARQIKILHAFLTNINTIIDSPILIFDGRIEGYNIRDTQDNSTIEIDVASHWSDFQKKAGRMTNTNSQKLHFPLDRGLEFSAILTRDIKWGRE